MPIGRRWGYPVIICDKCERWVSDFTMFRDEQQEYHTELKSQGWSIEKNNYVMCPVCNPETAHKIEWVSKEKECPICKKIMTVEDELEYSSEYSELYCSPDCAVTDYMDKACSKPIPEEKRKVFVMTAKVLKKEV